MRHLRRDYDAIQPWPVKREHNVRIAGHVITGVHGDPSGVPEVEPLIPDDEPVFLLRGQDPLAAELVERYADLYEEHPDADPLMIQGLRNWASEMLAWSNQAQHGLADVPPGMLREGRG